MSRRLLARVHATRGAWLGDATALGARPGIIATRQTWLNTRGRPRWTGHIRERDPSGPGGLISLARSLRGGPMSHRRAGACDGQQGVFGSEERPKRSGAHARPLTGRACTGIVGHHAPPITGNPTPHDGRPYGSTGCWSPWPCSPTPVTRSVPSPPGPPRAKTSPSVWGLRREPTPHDTRGGGLAAPRQVPPDRAAPSGGGARRAARRGEAGCHGTPRA